MAAAGKIKPDSDEKPNGSSQKMEFSASTVTERSSIVPRNDLQVYADSGGKIHIFYKKWLSYMDLSNLSKHAPYF